MVNRKSNNFTAKMNLMESDPDITPRYEFRTFGQNFDAAHFRMARYSTPVPEEFWDRHSDEIYIVSRLDNTHNIKIRDGKMDIKTLLEVREGFELWKPHLKEKFPLKAEVLAQDIFPIFQVEIPDLDKDFYSFEEFIHLVQIHPDLLAVKIHKQRTGYKIGETLCEYGIVLINGARVVTISCEAFHIADIRKTIHDCGLDGLENINYLQAIKRVTGMINKDLAN